MKLAERTGRILLTLLAILGAVFLLLPYKGINVDVVLSGSMEPVLPTGSIILTDTAKKEPEPGNIITYQLGDSLVTHRVVRRENISYITKGDANEKEDAVPVETSQIVGTVICTLPFLGYLAAFLKQKTIFTLLAVMMIQETIFGLIRWKGEHRKKLCGKTI